MVVSATEKARVFFEDFLTSCKYGVVTTVNDAAEARKALSNGDFALCVINSPLPDSSDVRLALETVAQSSCQCLTVVTEDDLPGFSLKLEAAGVFVISKPLKRDILWQTLRNIAIVSNRLESMREQNESLKRRIEDMQLVGRAKALLISSLKMSEPQAHRFLEKQAMERRMSKAEISRRVIRTYEE